MSLFNFNMEELLSFFAVLVRYSVLIAVLPFVGDNYVPPTIKVLLSLAISIALYPTLVASGLVHPAQAAVWGATASGIIFTIGMEVLFGLVLGYVARLSFEAISFGGHLVGNFMGFSMASTYDPNQQSQTQVTAQIHTVLAMLLFLILDGHHLMLRASLQSYQYLGVGGYGSLTQNGFNATLAQRLVELTGQVIRIGVQIAAPISVVLFGVNLIFGIMAKAMPQLNILILSVTISGLVGLVVLYLSVPELHGAVVEVLSRMSESMQAVMQAMAYGK